MSKINKITVQDISITLTTINEKDYICITDMVNGSNDSARAADVIKNWLRNRSTIEYLGAWESIYNPNFNVVEFDHFRKTSGLPTFVMSVSNWVEKTNAIGIVSRQGKYGGTYAHVDIALEFGSAISPVFKIYLIKEYQRLKDAESNQYNLEWNIRRVLTKTNFRLHTDAIKNHIVPKANFSKAKEYVLYASETDMLNIILFGCTAKDWEQANPQRVLLRENIRDMASINELAILSNLESLNSTLINRGVEKKDRFKILAQTAKEQRISLENIDVLKDVKKLDNNTFADYQQNSGLSDFNKSLKKAINFNPKKE